jgi:beta-lactam-binding protein with PASTA domain
VLKQTPQAGERVAKGTTVNFVLAIAPRIVVPDVIGKTFDQAATAVKTIGLAVGQRVAKESAEAAPGIVLTQNPASGTRVDKTTKVDLVVAAAPRIVIPPIIGKTFAEAESSLRNAGLATGMRRTKESSEAAPGIVLSQRPPAGQVVQQGAKVDLVVATKPAVLVPEIVKLSLAEAKTRLENVGLGLGQTRRREIYEPIATGNILEQIPRPGEKVDKGTKVDIVVSVRPSVVAVPDLVGKPFDEARALVGRGGLQLGAVQQTKSGPTPGLVLRQTPAAGEKVSWGTKIDLVVATRPDTAGASSGVSVRTRGQLDIPAGRAADLDQGSVATSRVEADLGFPRITAGDPYIEPLNKASMAKVPRVTPDGKSCASAPLSTAKIFIRDLPQNSLVCVRTNQGRYAVFRIVEPIAPTAPTLKISYTTWE